ncbi:MAG: prepilin-type N-terminal cleavage/methylation domain-containing protein [Verrucomicrobiota bacterium]
MAHFLISSDNRDRARAGFTFVELVVAMCIGAAVIMVAVLTYGTIARNGPARHQSNVTVTNAVALYGTTNNLLAVSEAPSFAAAAMAESMRERLLNDIASASAVCCLPRDKANPSGLRVTNLTLPTNFDVQGMVTPDHFRTNLIEPLQNAYVSYTGATTNANLSIYILGYSGNATNVIVKAIYETDLVNLTSNPTGVYASVRRYVGPILTDYYHVFYPDQTNNFSPLAVFFDQSSLGASGTASIDRYRQAAGRPFYFVWWPDPARKNLTSRYAPESVTNSNPRFVYSGMAGATSFFFVIPVFPSL